MPGFARNGSLPHMWADLWSSNVTLGMYVGALVSEVQLSRGHRSCGGIPYFSSVAALPFPIDTFPLSMPSPQVYVVKGV